MNFTQSAVSHAVQALENELGVTLLSRNRGGVVLTADGRLLLPRIEKLCAAHHELMRSAAELKGMDAGLCAGGHVLQRVGAVAAVHTEELRRAVSQHRI